MTEERKAELLEAGVSEFEISQMDAAEAHRDRYYSEFHVRCPKCGGADIETTYMRFALDVSKPEEFRDNSYVNCETCRWSGLCHDLMPKLVSIDGKIRYLASESRSIIDLRFAHGKFCVMAVLGNTMCCVGGSVQDTAEKSIDIAIERWEKRSVGNPWMF